MSLHPTRPGESPGDDRASLTRVASLLVAAVLLAAMPFEAARAVDLLRAPFLMVGTETSVQVRWRDNGFAVAQVRWGDAPGNLTNIAVEISPATNHRVTISGLQPATRYYYAIENSGQILAGDDADHYFETHPVQGSRDPIRIWVIGDSGTCNAPTATECSNVHKMRDEYLAFAGSNLANMMWILGDNAYVNGTDAQYTAAFFDQFPMILRNHLLYPTLGNHELLPGGSDTATETGPYFGAFDMPINGEAGGVPSGSEAYYSYNYGNIHVITLDSASQSTNLTNTGAMYQWLEQDLAAVTADWTIAYWHHPPYTKGSHNSDNPGEQSLFEMREIYVPLLESYGVDLVLSGHSHSYERSYLIDGHYGVSSTCALGECFVEDGDGKVNGDGPYHKASLGPAAHEGAVYSVVGSSGYNGGGLTHHPVMASYLNYEGSMVIDVVGSSLTGTFIDMDGVIYDQFQITKGSTNTDTLDLLGFGALVLALAMVGVFAASRRSRASV